MLFLKHSFWKWFFFLCLGLTVGFLLVFGSFLWFAFSPKDPHQTQKIAFEITPKEPPLLISKRLFKKNIIQNRKKFYKLGILLKKWPHVRIGEYALSPSMSPLQIFHVFEKGTSILHRITIPEGYNMYQIATLFEKNHLATKKDFLKTCKNPFLIRSFPFPPPYPESLEGYLFPETYFFQKKTPTSTMIKKMVLRFFKNWDEKKKERAKKLHMTLRQIITLASIIEKETSQPEERFLISSVFHNRLKKHIRLQSDPTTIYGIWEKFHGNLKKKHLKEKTPYNTYRIRGLPKGPIANPGLKSIEAALFPTKTNYLYFVSKNNGYHYFSKTFQEHRRAVRRYQIRPFRKKTH